MARTLNAAAFLATSALLGGLGCGLLIDGAYGDAKLVSEAGACISECPAGACGTLDNPCGGTLECPPCDTACVPKTCPELAIECGVTDDGCGRTLDCGKCGQANTTCQSGKCECRPKSCAEQGANCGSIGDGCGGVYFCGTCSGPTPFCGGGGQNKCGATACTPKTCAQLGKNCGTVDNCGLPMECGKCTLPQTCGGTGTPNLCGCQPKTQAQACIGRCIFAPDGCGRTVPCSPFCPGFPGICNQSQGVCF